MTSLLPSPVAETSRAPRGMTLPGAMPAVLILDGLWNKTVAAARSLGKRGYRIAVGERTRFAPALFSKYCSRRFLHPSPATSPGAFLDALEKELRVGGYDVVRIGRPPRIEMATWRYGERIKARRREHLKVYVPVAAVTVGAMVVLNVAAGVGIGGFFGQVPGIIDWTTTRIIGNRRLGVDPPICDNCGRLMVLRSKHVQHARLTYSTHADLALLLSCPHCQSLGAQLEGPAAEHALRAGMTYLNLTKRRAVKRKAKEAAVLVESSGGAEELLRRLAREERTVRALGTQQGLALEMAVDEQTELRELERQWKEAEEIAEIADNLGLASDVEESFRRLKDGDQPNG